jgi:hypothetical protein
LTTLRLSFNDSEPGTRTVTKQDRTYKGSHPSANA